MKKKILALVMAAFIAFPATALAADNEDPSDVESLDATALNGAAKLQWSKASDNVKVEGYFVHYGKTPVTKSGESYDEVVDVGDTITYTVAGLENDTKYYFSVVAYDAEGNESAAWAPEAETTPNADAGDNDDKDAPQVKEAEAVYNKSLKVVFSERIVIPAEEAQDAFAIENDETFESLEVTSAEMDDKDASGRTVILETAEQEEGATYKLTVGTDVEDLAGNPIISGTSDTAIFDGSGEAAPVVNSDGPEITNVEVVDNEHVLVSFNETIVLSIDPAENFEMVSKSDDKDTLEVLKVDLGDNEDGIEGSAALIKTSAQTAATYVLTVKDVTDEDGNPVQEGKDTIEFGGMGQGGETPDDGIDKQAPKDVAKLVAAKIFQTEKYLITLKWEIPAANVGDVVEQIIYMSTNMGESYSKKASLDPDVTQYEAGEFSPGNYWFKVTQVDEAGNESEGTITKVVLAETGPEMLGLLVFSLGMGRIAIAGRRKKRQ